eukprot:7380162-Prymnesium_polylepis.2
MARRTCASGSARHRSSKEQHERQPLARAAHAPAGPRRALAHSGDPSERGVWHGILDALMAKFSAEKIGVPAPIVVHVTVRFTFFQH